MCSVSRSSPQDKAGMDISSPLRSDVVQLSSPSVIVFVNVGAPLFFAVPAVLWESLILSFGRGSLWG